MRHRPNLTRLLIFLAILGTSAGVAAAIMRDPDPAAAESAPDVVATPTTAPAAPAPTAQAVQDCLPGSTGTYVSQYGSVAVLCELNSAGTVWQWTGVEQRDNAYAAAGTGATVTDSTGAKWIVKLASGGSRLWVWLPQDNTAWHPPTASYPAAGVTP
ncbi:MAG TPA: hypothetical protein VHV82_04440 [Sporichthyaceae bacterium]|nr:hypothetical protein [Sporichthyaceae bacterium]